MKIECLDLATKTLRFAVDSLIVVYIGFAIDHGAPIYSRLAQADGCEVSRVSSC